MGQRVHLAPLPVFSTLGIFTTSSYFSQGPEKCNFCSDIKHNDDLMAETVSCPSITTLSFFLSKVIQFLLDTVNKHHIFKRPL